MLCNTYFTTITHNLKNPELNEDLVSTSADVFESVIIHYANHPSILIIKEKFHNNECFEFKEASTHEISGEIHKLDRSKKVSGAIPIKVLQVAVREFHYTSVALTRCFHKAVGTGKSPHICWL